MDWYNELSKFDDDGDVQPINSNIEVDRPSYEDPAIMRLILNDLSTIQFIDGDDLEYIKEDETYGSMSFSNPLNNMCDKCNIELNRQLDNHICGKCGKVFTNIHEPYDSQPIQNYYQQTHIRLVGPNAHTLQSHLYKSSQQNYSMVQKLTVERILKYCCKKYMDRGQSSPIPFNVCRKAVDYYNEVQSFCIKRSETKNVTIAACLFCAGVEMGFLPTRQDIADFMELSTHGISKGMNFLISLYSEGKISFNPNKNVLDSTISTLFEYINIKDNDGLCRLAVSSIINEMKNANIGCSLYIETKVKGITYAVVKRSKDPSISITIAEFCEKCNTRKNTVASILTLLDKYHDFFKPIYKKYKLHSKRKLLN